MTLGGSELQLFVTFLVILACAFVALLMDYLKGNNEQLRERHVDLLVRQEQYAGKAGLEAAVLARSLEQVLGEQTEALKGIVAAAVTPAASPNPITSLQDLPVWEIPEPRREAPSSHVADGDKVKISLIPESEVKSPAPEPVAASQPEPEPSPEVSPEPAPASHDFDRFLDDLVSEFEANPAAYPPLPIPEATVPEPTQPEPTQPEPTEPAPLEPVAEQLAPLAAALEHTPAEPTREIPAGLQPVAVLEELLAAPPALQGIVVCVGINEFSQLHKNLGKQTADQFLGSVDALMSDFLRGKAFLCRRTEDEFLLIEPELTGAFAQRRLNDISERLWDFQLRNLGSFSVVFSWGAHEAHGESLRDAVEAAQEKMRETQAARKSSTFEKLRRRLATA